MPLSIEQQRAAELAEAALHDTMVRVPGGSRFQRHGESIRPFGPRLAAEILNRSEDEIRNKADPNKPDNFSHRELQTLMLEGMDPMWFEILLRQRGAVVIWMDQSGKSHDRITEELLACGKEFGDVCNVIAEARQEQSQGGRRITQRELAQIEQETHEAVGQMFSLLAAVKDEAGL